MHKKKCFRNLTRLLIFDRRTYEMETETLKAYKAGFADGIKRVVNFLESLPENELQHVPQKILVKMIKHQVENMKPEPEIEVKK